MNFETKLIDNISGIKRPKSIFSSGRVNHFDGNVIYCAPFPAPIGSLCVVKDQMGKQLLAELIRFNEKYNMLAILEHSSHIVAGCEVSLQDDGRYIGGSDAQVGFTGHNSYYRMKYPGKYKRTIAVTKFERDFENSKVKGGNSRSSQAKYYWATDIPIKRHNLATFQKITGLRD